MMPFFVDNFPPDALVRKPAFRFGAPIVSISLGLLLIVYVVKRVPISITLGDGVNVHYAFRSRCYTYAEVRSASLEDRKIKLGGHGSIPMTADETIFRMEFKSGPPVKISLNPSMASRFLETLSRKLNPEDSKVG